MAELSHQNPVVSVAVFAHNEATQISGSLAAICAAGLGGGDKVYVLINGSTDQSTAIVKAISEKDPRIHPVVLELGDKANAWNYYLKFLASPTADLHIFVDGDVRVSAGAFDEIRNGLNDHPKALAASTMPRGGRTSERWAKRVAREHGMPGNFYALTRDTVNRIRDLSIALPVGLVGDDPLLRWLLLRDFDPDAPINKHRILPVISAYFNYDSIPANSWSGFRDLVKRQLRYSLRDLQMTQLIQELTNEGLQALPKTIDSIHKNANPFSGLGGPLAIRKVAFLYTWLSTRSQTPRNGAAWFEV